jgi:hypothetical protein
LIKRERRREVGKYFLNRFVLLSSLSVPLVCEVVEGVVDLVAVEINNNKVRTTISDQCLKKM